MKAKSQATKYIFIIAWVLFAILGVYSANKTYQYEIIVKGILGITFLYLLFFYLRYSGTDASLNVLLSDPKPYRHLIFALIGPFLVYWATASILDMVTLLVKTWANT